MHICVTKLTIIGSDNGLSPGRRQAIISTNSGILLFGPLGINFSEILIEIHIFSLKKMKMLFAKWRPFFFVSTCFSKKVHDKRRKKCNLNIYAFHNTACISKSKVYIHTISHIYTSKCSMHK